MAPRKPAPPKPPRNPVARADAERQRKAGPIPPKKGKGTPYDRNKQPPADVDPDED